VRRRLFIAADIDDLARSECARVAEALRAKNWTARWVAPENYHLTVAFLGRVDDAHVGGLTAAARDAAAVVRAFDVPLDAVGAFPNERKPRVAWVGPAADVPAFGALCDAVRDPLAALGFAFAEHADAHVTLARSDGRVALPVVGPPRIAHQSIGMLTLYESLPGRTGARYVALDRFTLRG
jgi:2'-5' RNA ligase